MIFFPESCCKSNDAFRLGLQGVQNLYLTGLVACGCED